jgi:FkbM family methyltransferase
MAGFWISSRRCCMNMPHYKISYAQNREDLILRGVLRNVADGFYVDVGANHPEDESVTKIFYDKGWSGINIEPIERFHAELCVQRPRDINLKVGISSQPGRLSFRCYDDVHGHSTFSAEMRENLKTAAPDATFSDEFIEVTTLAEVLREHRPNGSIHFLKIDVEGLELEVLLGNKWHQFRPWVLCIEQTLDKPRRSAIAAFLEAWDYTSVFSDGINQYFIAGERRGVWDDFSFGRDVILDGVPVHALFIKYIASVAK